MIASFLGMILCQPSCGLLKLSAEQPTSRRNKIMTKSHISSKTLEMERSSIWTLYWEFEGHLGALTQDEVNLKAVISVAGLLTEST